MSSDAVRDALREIADSHGGRLTPSAVVEVAEDEESPLHSAFTWDDTAAAAKCRLEEARVLIRTVRVEVRTTQYVISVPAYLHDPGLPPGRQGYVSLGRLRNDEDMARSAILDEFGRANAALARAKAVARALGMEREIGGVMRNIMSLIERAGKPGHA